MATNTRTYKTSFSGITVNFTLPVSGTLCEEGIALNKAIDAVVDAIRYARSLGMEPESADANETNCRVYCHAGPDGGAK
jgi:hypothetical protein